MPLYHRLGQVPRKRHTVFRRADGGLHSEELIGNKGFSGLSSLMYHLRPPTTVREVRALRPLALEAESEGALRHRHFRTHRLQPGGCAVEGRLPLLFNADVTLSIAAPRAGEHPLFRNGIADEIVFVTEGSGRLESVFGSLPVRQGDYVVIPRGVLHRFVLEAPGRFLVIESGSDVRTPKRYRNEHGQLTEMAPYSERDIRRPEALAPRDETGDVSVLVKNARGLSELVLDHHPFDVVGWDGFYYPWAFSIHDFEPRVGRVHLPPPVHQTFEADAFVVCSFCPRPFDFDPEAVPAPYSHSNAMSDEVLYYANSEFMSRKGIEYGSITLHPDGIPHGPQPGKTEESLGAKWTNELAVMVDTFRPLRVTRQATAVEDEPYTLSWTQA